MQGMVTQVMGRLEGQQGPMRQTQDYQQQRANNPSWKEKKEEAELQEVRVTLLAEVGRLVLWELVPPGWEMAAWDNA